MRGSVIYDERLVIRDSVVIVQIELMRMRSETNRVELLLALPRHPRFHQIGGEYAALRQKTVILFERVDGLFQRSRRRANPLMLHFVAGHLVDVPVERCSWID